MLQNIIRVIHDWFSLTIPHQKVCLYKIILANIYTQLKKYIGYIIYTRLHGIHKKNLLPYLAVVISEVVFLPVVFIVCPYSRVSRRTNAAHRRGPSLYNTNSMNVYVIGLDYQPKPSIMAAENWAWLTVCGCTFTGRSVCGNYEHIIYRPSNTETIDKVERDLFYHTGRSRWRDLYV